ncbi:MAG: hypothetical protein AAF787_05185 [Chloroflexota bacterium]
MGSGRWSTDVYSARESKRKASGKSAFEYSETVKRSGKLKVHPSLDPHGVTFRESRDSAEHPATNAISVMFDVTGSMGGVPVQLQKYLPQLLGLLLYRNYISSPQILFGAIGDALSDRVPLQVGQFESDNRMDENLQNIVLERGGGPYGMESYELALYFMARHTSIDCYEKRKKKGYLFMIGDEMAYPKVDRKQVDSIVDGGLEASIRLEDMIAEVKEKYNLYFIVPVAASGGNADRIYTFWKERLGEQHVIRLDKVESIAETIALTIGTNEGRIGLDDGVEDLKEMGSDASTISSVKKALSILPVSNSVVKSEGSLGNLDEKSSKTRRL